ncbi:hypothetical protein ACIGEZ_31340 [Streptomyces sp. NPDC085481]|uniref:hypothetical protein n=1 Tax=Streptomyces sp. NPDC085481 TaxID=3365727 RepID=UPI0037D5A341
MIVGLAVNMKKLAATATLALAALALAAPAHAAHAADDDGDFGGGGNAADGWNSAAAAVCRQEVAVVPVMGDWVGDHADNCSDGNVVDPSGRS